LLDVETEQVEVVPAFQFVIVNVAFVVRRTMKKKWTKLRRISLN